MQRGNLSGVLFGIFLGLAWSVTAAMSTWAGPLPPGVTPLKTQEMRVTAYTKSFAKRFGLPSPNPGFELDEKEGLQAIEFSIEEASKWSPHYVSILKLYLNSSLPIHFPEVSNSGKKNIVNSSYHFFGENNSQFLKWNKNDRIFINTKDIGYAMKAFIANSGYDWGKNQRGKIDSIFYDEYHSSFLNNLAYVKLFNFQTFFVNFRNDIQKKKEIQLWLKAKNERNYNIEQPINANDFVKFSLPNDFLRSSLEYDSVAKNKNIEIDKGKKLNGGSK